MDSTSDDIKILQSLTCVKGSSVFFDVPKFIEQQHEFLKTMEPFKTLALQYRQHDVHGVEADTLPSAGWLSTQNRLDSNLGDTKTNEIPNAVLLISMPLDKSKVGSTELERQQRELEYGNMTKAFTKAGDTDLSHMFEFTKVKDVYTPEGMKSEITQFLQEVSLEKYEHATIILNGHGSEGGIGLKSGFMSYESLYGHIQQCYLNVETTGTNLKGLMVLNGNCFGFTGKKDHPADSRIVVKFLTNPNKPYTNSSILPDKDKHGKVRRILKAHHLDLEQEAREQYRETEKQLLESGHVIKSYAVTKEGKICLIL